MKRPVAVILLLTISACSFRTAERTITTTPTGQGVTAPSPSPSILAARTSTLVPSATLTPPTPVIPSATPRPTQTTVPIATQTASAPPPVATTELPATPSSTTVAVSACPGTEQLSATGNDPADLNANGQAVVAQPQDPTAPQAGEAWNSYAMRLILNRSTATVSATQTVVWTNRTEQAVPDIVFHLYPNLPDFGGQLVVTCATVNGAPVELLFEQNNWTLRLPLPEPIAPNAEARISMVYNVTTPENASQTNYGAFNLEDEVWSLASFYPILARRVADDWDTLVPNGWGDFVNSDMARYVVEVITNPDDGLLIGTGMQRGSCDRPRCTVQLVSGPQRDFVLVQAQGWQQLRSTVDGTTVVSSFPAPQLAAGQRALDLSADALRKFNQQFGPYPYSELDVLPVFARQFAGVEYPGVIMISTSYYAGDDDARLDMQDVVVHEVAHQWWYNVVGNDVLREPWLDEGLTSYAGEYLYTEMSGQQLKQLTANRKRGLEELGLNDTPIDLPVAGYDSNRAYVAVIYGRAPLFLAALRAEIGDDAFFRLLRTHYERNQFGIATTEEFKLTAQMVTGRSLDPFFAQWFTTTNR